jgi:hypothetical protein
MILGARARLFSERNVEPIIPGDESSLSDRRIDYAASPSNSRNDESARCGRRGPGIRLGSEKLFFRRLDDPRQWVPIGQFSGRWRLSPLCSARLRAPNEVTKTCESFLPDRPSVWQVLARLVPVAAQLPVRPFPADGEGPLPGSDKNPSTAKL